MPHHGLNRRALLSGAAAIAAAPLLSAGPALAQDAPASRTIPSTGEAIPAVGLGTWITFNVGDDRVLLDASTEVMRAFFAAGGRVIDSSPMYGSAQATVGYGLDKLGRPQGLYAADKVWTSGDGAAQAEQSRQLWRVPAFDLLQVHNLVAWERQLALVADMKAEGRLRHIGITTSEGRRHADFETIMASRALDFVQLSYNPLDREAETRLLPLAADRGIGVIVNRPFRQGRLTRALRGAELPGFAAELGATSWAQLILKFVLSHPAVTVVIPATTVPGHAAENVAAAAGAMPDGDLRERIAAAVAENA